MSLKDSREKNAQESSDSKSDSRLSDVRLKFLCGVQSWSLRSSNSRTHF